VRLCIVSFKECWQDGDGRWASSGGFPAQMAALGALFDELTLVIVRGRPQAGGIPLPSHAHVVPLRSPVGTDARRKISVVANAIYYLTSLARHMRDADVVHTPVPGDIPFLGIIVAKALRKRLLVRYGASWITNGHTTWMERVTRAWMRRLAKGNNVMLALGPVGSATVPAPRMHWIFATTISRDEVTSVQPAVGRPPHASLQLAYVGRLSPEKGLLHLLEAVGSLRADPALSQRVPHLTLIGDGPQRAELVAAVKRLRCEDIVDFAGQVDRGALVTQLLGSDVCVLPSLTEGFCKARLDAMLCGVPVITTDVGFGREIVGSDGERGWVVPPGDVPALVTALRRVVTERLDWPNLRLRCRRYVEGQTLEAWAGRIADICARQWNLSIVDGKLRSRTS
jgi:glycosyltransferase involved in cell wall biosynthesis